jgi:hypothetical protein
MDPTLARGASLLLHDIGMPRSDSSRMSDPHILRPDHHPTPFTAAEIRQASQVGRTVRQVVEVEGEPTVTRILRWIEADADGATGLVVVLDEAGTRVDEGRARSTWLELQGHASMPIETTTVDEVILESPMGPLECLRYTAVRGDAIDTFWFARTMPGMPVRTERVRAGRVVERTTVIANEVEPLPAELAGDGPEGSPERA